MTTETELAAELRAGNIFYKYSKVDFRNLFNFQANGGNKLGIRVVLENSTQITAVVPKFSLVEWTKETDGSINTSVFVTPTELPVRIYQNHSDNEITSTPSITEGSNFYTDLNNGVATSLWHLCLFTKAQIEAIFGTSGTDIVISGSTIRYASRFYNNVENSNIDSDFDYFTLKLEANEIEDSSTVFNNAYSSSVLEVAAPCPPLWRPIQ